MQKNSSYVIKLEKICTKRYLEILVAFIVFANDKVITLSTLLQETHIFTKMIINN
jgi:hypothetical protein